MAPVRALRASFSRSVPSPLPRLPGRPRLRVRLVGILALLATAVAASVARAEGECAPLPPGPRFGAVDAAFSPERATQAGIQWERLLFDWSRIQRHSPDQWDLATVAPDLVRRELASGRQTVGLLMSTPSWASGTRDPKSPPLNLHLPFDHPDNYWGRYVYALVSWYRGLVDHWVVWNEPDVWSDSTGGKQWNGTVEQYARLLQVAYLAARKANPDAFVLMAGLTYWWDRAYGRELYFQRVLAELARTPGARDNAFYFDAAVLQLYNNPRSLYDIPRELQWAMAQYGLEKPIWINETNVVPHDDPAAPLSREHFRATLQEQASYVVQAIAYAMAAGVQRVAFYKMQDDFDLRPGQQAFGLVRADADHTPRPALLAYRTAIRYFSDVTCARLAQDGPVVRVEMEAPGRLLHVLWSAVPADQEASVPALAGQALLVERYGHERPIEASDGVYKLRLPGATHNTVPNRPDIYFTGGEPFILVEERSDGWRSPCPLPTPDGPSQRAGSRLAGGQILEDLSLDGTASTAGTRWAPCAR